jgi:hypothetical protein
MLHCTAHIPSNSSISAAAAAAAYTHQGMLYQLRVQRMFGCPTTAEHMVVDVFVL